MRERGSRGSIWVIGHQQTRVHRVCELLSQAGFDPLQLAPETIPEMLRKGAYVDLILLMADLPVAQGKQLAQAVYGVSILVVGSGHELELTQGYDVMGAMVLLEPYTLERLVAQVHYCLRREQIQRHQQQQIERLQEQIQTIEADNWRAAYLRKQAVVDIFNHLRDEVTARIQSHLQTFCAKPHLINQLNHDLVQDGLLDPNQIQRLQRQFWRQMQRFPEIGTLVYATQTGIYVGVMRMQDGSFSTELKPTSSDPHKRMYRIDPNGQITSEQLGISPDYDPCSRPWYQAGVRSRRPTWSPPYQFTTTAEVQLGIMAVQPLWDRQGEIMGVVGADVIPWQLSGFLQGIWSERAGSAFIIDREGWLVANSAAEPAFGIDHHKALQYRAWQSQDPWISQTVQYLIQRFGDLQGIDRSQRCEFLLDRETQYVQIQPFQDEWGLDWLVILVVPESDILKQPHADTWTQIHQAFATLQQTNRALEQQIHQRTAQLREQQRLNQIQEDFFSLFSHELRTPLANLRMALHMTRWATNETSRQKFFEIALRECETEIELITDLVNLKRLESGTYELAIEPIQFTLWLSALIEVYQVQAESHQQELICDLFDPSLEQVGVLHSDRFCLERILRELLTNALKYTAPRGQIRVEVSPGLHQIQIQVGNSTEIPVEELPRIFDKFYRVPQGDQWNRGGTGLGLALVKRMVQCLQGQIWVTSQSGWTWFGFCLPLHDQGSELQPDLDQD